MRHGASTQEDVDQLTLSEVWRQLNAAVSAAGLPRLPASLYDYRVEPSLREALRGFLPK